MTSVSGSCSRLLLAVSGMENRRWETVTLNLPEASLLYGRNAIEFRSTFGRKRESTGDAKLRAGRE